jgi:predicted DNA-binding transcriptional regulator AlpA
MTQGERAVTEIEAATVLGLSVATLRAWRHRGRGPKFVRFGRAVRYLTSELDDFVRRSTVTPAATTTQGV